MTLHARGGGAPRTPAVANVCLLLAVLAAGACGSGDHAVSAPTDSWYRGFARFDPKAETLAPERVFPVPDASLAEATTLLQEIAIVRLSPRETERLLGRAVPTPGNLEPFLTRAVSRGDGAFFVKQAPTALWIGHRGGDVDAPLRRRAVVVLLESWTTDVYVTTGVPE